MNTKELKVKIAYFSMEIGFDEKIPTYCGGLGVLAGDTLKSCADFKVPIVGVTLVSRKGFFHQKIIDGSQVEEDQEWNPEEYMGLLDAKAEVLIEGRPVYIKAWKYELEGIDGFRIPILFLDTDLPENTEKDRRITDNLYGGDLEYRLKQETVLGIGGVRILNQIGFAIEKYHMNEGHSSLLALELLKKEIDGNGKKYVPELANNVKKKCIFTTHTPIPAGHDKFPYKMVDRILSGYMDKQVMEEYGGKENLNMTLLGFKLSRYINGVAKKHSEVSRDMFPGYTVYAITNGIHHPSWTCKPFQGLYDKYIKDWRRDPFLFRYVVGVPGEEIWEAHTQAKKDLMEYLEKNHGEILDEKTMTIGFARRMTEYKRPTMIFSDAGRLREISAKKKIQIIFSGKAHPKDLGGKQLIKEIIDNAKDLKGSIDVVYLEDYDIGLAKKLVSGVDLWLNTPQKPKEASGTSGMKATLNGVLNFSVLDGWWIEGYMRDTTGWSIGTREVHEEEKCIEDLYRKLDEITSIYYNRKDAWIKMMKNAISLNASFFNSDRMINQYVVNAYIS